MTGRMALLGRRKQAQAAADDETAAEAAKAAEATEEAVETTEAADVAAADEATEAADGTRQRSRGSAQKSRGSAQKRSKRAARRARRAEAPPRRGRGRISVGTQILVLLALVTVALAVAVVSLQHRRSTLSGTDSGAQKAMYTAAQAAQDLSSYDYRTLESDIKTAAGQTTGKLRTDYQKQAQAIMATARQQQVVVNAQTVKSGVVSATPHEAVVLVFLNRTTSKAAGAEAGQQRTPDQLRLLMTMNKVGDRWLVAKVDVM